MLRDSNNARRRHHHHQKSHDYLRHRCRSIFLVSLYCYQNECFESSNGASAKSSTPSNCKIVDGGGTVYQHLDAFRSPAGTFFFGFDDDCCTFSSGGGVDSNTRLPTDGNNNIWVSLRAGGGAFGRTNCLLDNSECKGMSKWRVYYPPHAGSITFYVATCGDLVYCNSINGICL